MLKLTYTENGFCLEHLAQPMENWVATRVVLALRSATPLFVEPSTASFLLPADLPHLTELESLSARENTQALSLAVCDDEYVEVCLNGTWLVSEPESEEGIFVTTMSDRAEFFLFKLWQEAESIAFLAGE